MVHLGPIKHAVAFLLLASYAVYVYLTMKSEGDLGGDTRALYFHAAAESPMLRLILLQLFVALSAIILGADLFVRELTKLAEALSVPPLIISLLLTPVATELPENMVFQSAIPVAVGVAFTPWQLDRHGLLAAGLALASGSLLWLRLRITGRVGVGALLTGGVFYLVFVVLILSGVV